MGLGTSDESSVAKADAACPILVECRFLPFSCGLEAALVVGQSFVVKEESYCKFAEGDRRAPKY